ncbi:MAG: protein kinase domain-containing protein [Caldimonas sp.]
MSTLPPDSPPPPASPSGTDHDALPPGTRFGEFEILRVLGVGGFGIVYLANDHSLEREVALKEYMPASLAARGQGPQITVRSSSFAETYAIGLRSFVNEARLLARFDHPSLVKVYRFWEDNATAYMVMPYLQGVTLRDTRRRMAHPPDEAWIRSVISPILSALELLHREGVYHRDIAPDNILLPPDGPPVLLDFGAARRVISDRTQSLTAILKPSYAPIEQYAEMTQLRQGPWTDLYALGAVIHYLLFGAPPAPATARAVQDDTEAIENRIVPGVSPRFLEAVSWMLAIRPNQRPQSGEQLRAVLDGSAQIPPRGRPGITIPPNLATTAPAPAAPADPRRQIESAADATFINTAHIPTHLPTAHAPPPGQTRAPATTTFSPTAQMPTARMPPPSAFETPFAAPAAAPVAPPPAAPRTAPPRAEAAPSQWPASRPSTLPPPSRPAPLAAETAPPRSRPVPLAPAAGRAAAGGPGATAKSGGSKSWMVLAGVVGVLVVVAAAAWQFAAKREAAGADPALSAASAAAAVPAVAPIVVPAPAPVTAATTLPSTTSATPPAAAPTLPAAPVPEPAAAPATNTAATLPEPARVVAPSTTRPATTAGRNDLPVETGSRPVPERTSIASDRNAVADHAPLTASSSAGVARAPRPVGLPVPRARAADPAAAGSTGTPVRSPDASPGYGSQYGTPPTSSYGNPNERPRALGLPPPREPVVVGRPVPQQPAPVVVGRPVPQQPAPVEAQPTSAREACGKRVFIALALCMDEKCEEARWRNTPECVGILDRKRARETR